MLDALKTLSGFFTKNTLKNRRSLRSDVEKRSLAIGENFASCFAEVKKVAIPEFINLIFGFTSRIGFCNCLMGVLPYCMSISIFALTVQFMTKATLFEHNDYVAL